MIQQQQKKKGGLRGQFAKGVSGAFGLKLSLTGFAFIIGIFLARLLDVEGYGIYSYCTAWIALLQVPAELGSRIILAREVAAYESQEKWGFLKGLLTWMNRSILLASIGLTVLVAIGVWAFTGGFGSSASDVSDPAVLTFLFALCGLPFFALNAARQGTMQGFRAITLGLMPESLIQPIVLIASVGAAYFFLREDLSVTQVMFLRSCAIAVSFATGALFLYKTVPPEVVNATAQYDIAHWRKSMLPFVLISCTYIINTRTDVLMLGMLDGTESSGIYSVASRGANLLTFVVIAVNMSLSPVVSSLYATGQIEKLQRAVRKSSNLIFIGSLLFAAVLVALNRWFFLAFGAGFLVGSSTLMVLTFGHLVNALVGTAGMILDMTGHERYSAIATTGSAGLNILLNWWLIPIYGLIGAAIATTVSMALRSLFLLICVRKTIGIRTSVLGWV
ncbi:MAG: flippase [Cyanobacteria bacterium J06650_10]